LPEDDYLDFYAPQQNQISYQSDNNAYDVEIVDYH